ncbi:hypothetical protein KKC88_02510 [Patescibacteria group bacterium]|nr:hypothetical protein [Patescibacteria group bacterium]MBU1672927.1 hypothetical protein [Patescibacteria group bacterium]MBU1963345.1 hypothetical protein [Patescibacteria group bacterium]
MSVRKHLDIILIVIIFLAAFSLSLYWQASEYFTDPDTFYHMKMAESLADGKLILDFPWQQFSLLNDQFTDQHFLYHIILAGFSVVFTTLVGTKLAVAFLFSGFILVFCLVIRSLGVKWPWLWGLILTVSVPFAFRLNLVKANALSLIILFTAIYLLVKYKPAWLFGLSFVFVWAYGGWPIMAGMVFLYGFFNIVFYRKWKESLILLGSSAGGLLAGVIINPYFPNNLTYYWQQFVQIGIINYQDKIGVGGEWYPYAFSNLVSGAVIAFLFLGLAIFLFIYDFKKQKKVSWFALIIMLGFLALTLKSKRYVEYCVPFIVFYSAVIVSLSLPKKWLREFFNFAGALTGKRVFFGIGSVALILFLAFMVPAVIGSEIKENKNDLRRGLSYYKLSMASRWLEENSEPGSIVLHSDWDIWPSLYYWNESNYYIIGLDPTFMYNYDQDLYWKWVHITKGEEKEAVYDQAKNDFHASYMLVEEDHKKMERNIRRDDRFEQVYEDDEATIFRLLE